VPVARPHVGWWISIFAGMGLFALLSFSGDAFAWWVAHVFWLPPRWLLVVGFVAAVGAHVGEAAYAYRVARAAGEASPGGWLWQTLALGFPSLRLLLARVRRGAGDGGRART
jgi:hypothetical protein